MIDATLPTELTPEEREGFAEAQCAGAEGLQLSDYFGPEDDR
jgi:hypothetical protein